MKPFRRVPAVGRDSFKQHFKTFSVCLELVWSGNNPKIDSYIAAETLAIVLSAS